MTPEQKRIAIAELCGWKWVKNHCFKNGSFMGSESFGDGWRRPNSDFVTDNPSELPDYTNCLNAMHEAEKVFTQEDQKHRYLEALAEVVMSGKDYAIDAGHAWLVTHATAAKRADAFLLAHNILPNK